MKSAQDYRIDAHPGDNFLENLPRGWLLIVAGGTSWLVFAALWAVVSPIFFMLLALV